MCTRARLHLSEYANGSEGSLLEDGDDESGILTTERKAELDSAIKINRMQRNVSTGFGMVSMLSSSTITKEI